MFLPPGPTWAYDQGCYKENAELLFHGQLFHHARYPPLYSLVISPAFYFENWFNAILFINCLYSSLLIIPVWLISRMFVSQTFSLIAVLITLLLPFQTLYPGFVMSENLFLFIFTFAVFFTIRGVRKGSLNSGLFGIFLALGYLTKYLMLAAIPMLVLFWMMVPALAETNKLKILTAKPFWRNCLIAATCFLFTILPWFIYAHYSDIEIFHYALSKQYLGAGNQITKPNGLQIPHGTLFELMMWICANSFYLVLALAPSLTLVSFYLPVLAYLRKRHTKEINPEFIFIGFLFALTAVFWLISVQHSFMAPYNYPRPIRIMGRYLMQMTPLFIIGGMIALAGIFRYRELIKSLQIIIATTVILVLMILANWILFNNGIWIFPDDITRRPFPQPDSFFYGDGFSFILAMIFIFIFGISVLLLAKAKKQLSNIVWLVILGVLITWQGLIFKTGAMKAQKYQSGLHYRKLASVLMDGRFLNDKIPVYTPARNLGPEYLDVINLFWGSPNIKNIRVVKSLPVFSTTDTVLILTEDSLNLSPLATYPFRDGNYYLYKLNAQSCNIPTTIIDYGPQSISAGEKFNVQPNGMSAIWLKINIPLQSLVVYFDGRELPTSVNRKGSVSATVPGDLTSNPGKKEVYLVDKFFNVRSNPVLFEIRQPR